MVLLVGWNVGAGLVGGIASRFGETGVGLGIGVGGIDAGLGGVEEEAEKDESG